jgi:hypothetical protein
MKQYSEWQADEKKTLAGLKQSGGTSAPEDMSDDDLKKALGL